MPFSALWKNQCWTYHRIRCITKFFTEFGAEKCTFSFTGGYRAHTSFNALLTCQKVSLKNNFLTCKISRLISIVLIKDSFVPTDCCLAQYEKWDRLKLFDTSLFGETILLIGWCIFSIIKESHQNYRGHFWLREERNQKLSCARAPSRLLPNCHMSSLSLLRNNKRFVLSH